MFGTKIEGKGEKTGERKIKLTTRIDKQQQNLKTSNHFAVITRFTLEKRTGF